MRIAYNPLYKPDGKTKVGALKSAPINDIVFDLPGKSIWAKGLKFLGTDSLKIIIGSSSDTVAGTWTGQHSEIGRYEDGLTIIYIPKVAGASTTTLNINGLGAKTCYYSSNSKLTTHYSAGTPILFTYYNDGWRRADYNINYYRPIEVNDVALLGNNNYTLNFKSDGNISYVTNSATNQADLTIGINIKTLKNNLGVSTTINSVSTNDQLPTSKSVYDFVGTYLTSYMHWKGNTPSSGTTFTIPNVASVGDAYRIAVAGTIPAANSIIGSAQVVEVGDIIICTDATGPKYTVAQTNWTTVAGTSALVWNSEVTLATIGGLAIKAKLPANPTLALKSISFTKADGTAISYNGSAAVDLTGGINYATLANQVKNNLIIKWGNTEGTNLFTYNGSVAKTIDLSAPFSQLFTSFGNVDTGFKSTNITATVSGVTKSFVVNWAIYAGRSQTADKWTTARTLTIGNTGKSVDGSANVSWSLAEIGVSAAAHTHSVKINGATKTIAASSGAAVDLGNYLPLSGGTMSGNITINTDSEIRWNRNTDYSRIHFKNESDSDTDSYMGFETGDNGNEYFRFAGNNGGTVTQWMSIKADGVRASAFIGNLKGNASTATKLESSAGNAALPIYFSDGKPVACVPSSLFSTLSNSGNNLSITIAGQNRTLTVNYASNASSAEYLNNYSISDPNTQALKDNKVKWFAQINTSSGYAGNNYGFPVGNNANGILYLGTHPGKYGHQLGFSSNGNIYHRFQNGSDFPQTANGGSWSVLLTSTNYSSILDNRYYTETEADNRFVNITGDTMTGLLVTTQGSNHSGIKVGNTYINAINGDLIFQNNSAIRFGGDSWDYNVWAGLKYVHSSKIIYLGLADNSAFTANSAQSGGKLYLPGIVNIYTGNGSNLVWHAGNDGSGSGLDADMTDGLHVHSGRNNEANKIVRTDGSGYIQAGWINTTSGDMGTTTATRVYCSNDAYIRYKTLANFSSDIAGQLYWANVKVSTASSTATQPTFNTCYTSNWFRSTGSTGWHSETYGGGIYMEDTTWIRTYGNKKFYISNGDYNAIHSAGGVYVAGMVHAYANYLKSTCNGAYVQIGPQNSSHAHYETDASISHWFNKRVDVNGAIWRYGSSYGITSDGYFHAKGVYANRTGSSTDGGVSLYSNVDPMTYGIAFRGTGTYGTHGYVTSANDWATYLTMNDSTTRGWIFRRGNTNVASIAGNGNMAIGQHLKFSNEAHISTNRSTDYHYGYTFNLGANANSIGMYSGPAGEAGGVVISPDGCLIYNSSDCGYNLQVRDKDLGTDLTNIATLTFGIEQDGHYAWSRGGFKKNGSSNDYVLLGGGGHKAISDFSMSHSHPYLPLSGGTMTGDIHISHATTNNPNKGSTNPKIIFSENGSQQVALVYTDYDSYRSSKGLKVTDFDGSDGGNVWFEITGSCYVGGSTYSVHFYENSDIRYKKILKNLLINSNTIATLPLFDFEWIENNTIGTGTSAQAVQEILPNIVSGTDKLTLDYGVLGTIAGITACKELVTQKSEIELLKERIEQLEQQLKIYHGNSK